MCDVMECIVFIFIFKQKTAYEMRISDWSSDVCSSDLCQLGFTHLELLPVSEYPFEGSWGYQPTGLFAPTSRFGPPEGFKRFMDRCQEAGLGVQIGRASCRERVWLSV